MRRSPGNPLGTISQNGASANAFELARADIDGMLEGLVNPRLPEDRAGVLCNLSFADLRLSLLFAATPMPRSLACLPPSSMATMYGRTSENT